MILDNSMPHATQAAFDAGLGFDEEAIGASRSAPAATADLSIAVYGDLGAIEQDWRAFESNADCTVFQSFDWLSTWQQHIGARNGVRPVIVAGRDRAGRMLFIFPLSIEGRTLTWLGTKLCDYNGPLLAPDFGKLVNTARFAALWHDVVERLRRRPGLRFDLVHFDKMQDVVGAQANPFVSLGVSRHANGAYLTHLYGDWDKFYGDKRSSATRRRDRTKRKKLGEFGEVRFATPETPTAVATTLDTLMSQKSKAFAAMGVTDLFSLPGYREFYRALAARPDFVHVSRLDVGDEMAAANLALIFHGSYYHLLASYHGGELSKYGPGAAHLHDLLRYAIDKGCKAFDFTIGDERYKKEWSDSKIVLFDHVEAVTPRGIPEALKIALVGRLKRVIKQTPAIWHVAEKVRAGLGRAKRLRG